MGRNRRKKQNKKFISSSFHGWFFAYMALVSKFCMFTYIHTHIHIHTEKHGFVLLARLKVFMNKWEACVSAAIKNVTYITSVSR